MYKLVLRKAEEPEIKLPTSIGSSKKHENSRKTSTALLTMPEPLTVDQRKLWKILKEMGILDHLTSLLRNLFASQEATVRTGHRTDWFQIRKGVRQGCTQGREAWWAAVYGVAQSRTQLKQLNNSSTRYQSNAQNSPSQASTVRQQ